VVVEIKGYDSGLQMKGPQKRDIKGCKWQIEPSKNLKVWRMEG